MLSYFDILNPKTPLGVWVEGKENVSIFSAIHDISWTFFDPLKFPLRPPGWGGGNFFRYKPFPDVSAYMRAKFGRGPTVVSKKKRGPDRQTYRQTDTHKNEHCSLI